MRKRGLAAKLVTYVLLRGLCYHGRWEVRFVLFSNLLLSHFLHHESNNTVHMKITSNSQIHEVARDFAFVHSFY
jgi:hypothetical protein